MGIRQFGHVKFDGVDLADFGVTLSGTGTYNAPERDVTYQEVKGRSGDLVFDNGRYKNITVTYPVNIEIGLPEKVDMLKAYLMSHKGYFRLEDNYHPDVYRMAEFVGPIDFNVTGSHNRYGRTELAFNCKPQRFLKSGEIALPQATSSVSPETVYAYSDFTSYSKDLIDGIAGLAGYTASEISSMKYSVLDFSSLTLTEGDMLEFLSADSVPYFRILCNQNPLTSSGNTSNSSTWRTYKWGQYNTYDYAVQPYDFNMRLLVNGVKQNVGIHYTIDDIYNPTRFEASPALKISGIKGTEFSDYVGGINDCGIYLNWDNSVAGWVDTITIDPETMNAYSLPEDNKNGVLWSMNEYIGFTKDKITIEAGHNELLTNDLTDGITVVPNWWTI